MSQRKKTVLFNENSVNDRKKADGSITQIINQIRSTTSRDPN